MENQSVRLRTPSNASQSARVRRRSLNISHFNALQNAVSNLQRIDDFDLEDLGYGFFSDVFKVTHKQTGHVMVLKRNKNNNSKMNILREVQLMNRLSHPNILKFKGVCVHEGQLHALTEFINGGDMDQLITEKKVTLTWKQRIQLSLDVAKGMKYLHSMGIIHRDFAAKNCLVRFSNEQTKRKYTGIVADLGLAEKIPPSLAEEHRLSIVGTPYIMAPEVLRGKTYNETADLFSYGIFLCQFIALVSNDPEELPRSDDFGLARDLFQKLISVPPPPPDSSLSSSLPPPEKYLQLAFDCCQISPTSRPPFSEIVSKLEDLVVSLKKKRIGRSSSVRIICDDDETKPLKRNRPVSAHNDDNDDIIPKADLQRNRSSSSSSAKLSRSFSDISREILSHTANMFASVDDVMDDVSDSYSNPFSALKHLNGGKMKLTDEPSTALLEMTFDLTTWDNLRTTVEEENVLTKRKQRSKSVISVDGAPPVGFPRSPYRRLLSPARSSHSNSHLNPALPRSPRLVRKQDNCRDCNYQRASSRAMILSPMGNNLTSWWCNRRQTCNETIKSRKQSLAGVMSVLSGQIRGNGRRCISLPDISRINALFEQAEKEEKPLVKLPNTRTRRPGTVYVEDFYLPSKETILEENESDFPKVDSSRTSVTNLRPKESLSNNDIALSSSTNEDSEENLPPVAENLTLADSNKSNPTQSMSSPLSSSSSEGSSQCLTAALHSGETSRQRRKSRDHLNLDSSCQRKDSNPQSSACSPPKSNNRDSGYEDASPDDHSHFSVSSPGYESQKHPVYRIPEERISPSISFCN